MPAERRGHRAPRPQHRLCARAGKIKPDEEITVDYGKDYFSAFIGKSRCRCVKCRERRAEQQASAAPRPNARQRKRVKLRRERRAAAKRKR